MLADYYTEKISYAKVGNARKKRVLELLRPLKMSTVLDVGCGPGAFGESIKAATGATVHGIDVSTSAIEEARKRLDLAMVFDVEGGEKALPSSGLLSRYDVILVSEVLEHLFFPEKLLSGLKQFASEETHIILTVPNVLFWKNRLAILFGRFEYTDVGLMDRGHVHFFTWKTFTQMIQAAGYTIIENNNNYATRGTRSWLGPLFPGLFAYQLIVHCKISPDNDSRS